MPKWGVSKGEKTCKYSEIVWQCDLPTWASHRVNTAASPDADAAGPRRSQSKVPKRGGEEEEMREGKPSRRKRSSRLGDIP